MLLLLNDIIKIQNIEIINVAILKILNLLIKIIKSNVDNKSKPRAVLSPVR